MILLAECLQEWLGAQIELAQQYVLAPWMIACFASAGRSREFRNRNGGGEPASKWSSAGSWTRDGSSTAHFFSVFREYEGVQKLVKKFCYFDEELNSVIKIV